MNECYVGVQPLCASFVGAFRLGLGECVNTRLARFNVRMICLPARMFCGILPDSMAKEKKLTFSEFARIGGKARAKKLTAEQRKASARKAAKARWAKQKGKFSRDTET